MVWTGCNLASCTTKRKNQHNPVLRPHCAKDTGQHWREGWRDSEGRRECGQRSGVPLDGCCMQRSADFCKGLVGVWSLWQSLSSAFVLGKQPHKMPNEWLGFVPTKLYLKPGPYLSRGCGLLTSGLKTNVFRIESKVTESKSVNA